MVHGHVSVHAGDAVVPAVVGDVDGDPRVQLRVRRRLVLARPEVVVVAGQGVSGVPVGQVAPQVALGGAVAVGAAAAAAAAAAAGAEDQGVSRGGGVRPEGARRRRDRGGRGVVVVVRMDLACSSAAGCPPFRVLLWETDSCAFVNL